MRIVMNLLGGAAGAVLTVHSVLSSCSRSLGEAPALGDPALLFLALPLGAVGLVMGLGVINLLYPERV